MNLSRICIILDNTAGALARVVSLFRRRSFNIVALSVGETDNPKLSRMTILSDADPSLVRHVQRQLQKQEFIHAAEIMPNDKVVERELVIVKTSKAGMTPAELSDLQRRFAVRVLETDADTYIFEFSGADEETEAFIRAVTPLGLMELSRTGETALVRGNKTLYKYFVR